MPASNLPCDGLSERNARYGGERRPASARHGMARRPACRALAGVQKLAPTATAFCALLALLSHSLFAFSPPHPPQALSPPQDLKTTLIPPLRKHSLTEATTLLPHHSRLSYSGFSPVHLLLPS